MKRKLTSIQMCLMEMGNLVAMCEEQLENSPSINGYHKGAYHAALEAYKTVEKYSKLPATARAKGGEA